MRVPSVRPSRRSGAVALGGTALAAAALVAGLQQGAASSPLAGTCTDRDAAPTPCSAAGAVYEVLTTVPDDAANGSACPRGDYVERRGGPGTLCLGYNVAAGDCIEDDPEGAALVACAPRVQRPTFQVLSVVGGRASAASCSSLTAPTKVVALTYSVPARTLCITHLPLATG